MKVDYGVGGVFVIVGVTVGVLVAVGVEGVFVMVGVIVRGRVGVAVAVPVAVAEDGVDGL